MRRLQMYRWYGNVRELQAVIKYALLHAVGDTITSGSLPPIVRGDHDEPDSAAGPSAGVAAIASMIRDQLARTDGNLYRDIHSAVDRILLDQVLAHVDGNQVQAAQVLGISRTTLRNRLSELEINGTLATRPESAE
jgi:two-component system nitrogen regulation response regulator GlnG